MSVTTATVINTFSTYNNTLNLVIDAVGVGENGYGYANIEQGSATTSTLASAIGWSSLMNAANRLFKHQTNIDSVWGGLNLTKTISTITQTVTSGTVITTSTANRLLSTATVYADVSRRYTVHPSQLQPRVTTNGVSTRTSSWSVPIKHELEATWPTALAANYFFNLGGYLDITASHANNASGGDNDSWKTIIGAIGTQQYTRSDWVAGGLKTWSAVTAGGFEYQAQAIKGSDNRSVKITIELRAGGPASGLIVIPNSAVWSVSSTGVGSFTVNAVLPSQGNYAFSGTGSATGSIGLRPDGSLNISGTGAATTNLAWGTPIIPNIGSGYHVRFTLLSSTGFGSIRSTFPTTGWTPILGSGFDSIAVAYAATDSGQGNTRQVSQYQVDISPNSSGSPIVATGIYTLTVDAFGNLFTVVNPLPSQGSYTWSDFGTITVTLSFSSDGTFSIDYVRQYSTVSGSNIFRGNWGTPTSSNAGNAYWIRFTRLSTNKTGSGSSDSSVSTGWLSLSLGSGVDAVSVNATADAAADTTQSATYLVEIASDSGGINVLSSGQYTISATGRLTVPSEGGCPTPDMGILLADDSWAPAGELQVGQLVKTQHEHTLEWGTWPITAIETVREEALKVVFNDGKVISCSLSHKFYAGNSMWIQAFDLVEGMWLGDRQVVEITLLGWQDVVKITVDQARTYICEGLLSHNVKIIKPDSPLINEF